MQRSWFLKTIWNVDQHTLSQTSVAPVWILYINNKVVSQSCDFAILHTLIVTLKFDLPTNSCSLNVILLFEHCLRTKLLVININSCKYFTVRRRPNDICPHGKHFMVSAPHSRATLQTWQSLQKQKTTCHSKELWVSHLVKEPAKLHCIWSACSEIPWVGAVLQENKTELQPQTSERVLFLRWNLKTFYVQWVSWRDHSFFDIILMAHVCVHLLKC